MYFRQVEYDVISAIIMMKLPHSLDTTGGGSQKVGNELEKSIAVLYRDNK